MILSPQNFTRTGHRYMYGRCLLLRQSSSNGTTSTTDTSEKQPNNNSHIQPTFCNRNPRNLELLTISQKPQGYHLDSFKVKFWHKLIVKEHQSHVTAEIVHNKGNTVVSASSSEFGIRRFLYRATDTSAFRTVGKVIARRCLESGINSVYCDIEGREDTKLAFLLQEAMNGGLSLKEAPVYQVPFPHTRGVPTKPWDIIS